MSWLPAWESFVRVVEGGSMAAAARTLGCTRAQVSKQVAELERRLGAALFERSTRRLVLTPAGEVFLRHAARALEAVDSSEIAVRNLGERPSGTLRVSATLAFGRHFVAPLLPVVTAANPGLEIELVLTDRLVDLVDDRIDLALRMTARPPEDAVARHLLRLRWVLCAASAYVERHGSPREPAELAQHACIGHPAIGAAPWGLVAAAGAQARVAVRSRVRFDSLDCTLDAVLAGHGIAILPAYLCEPALQAGSLRTVLDGWEPAFDVGRDLYACYTPGRVGVSKVRVFMDALQQRLQPLPSWACAAGVGG
ncbi:MAG: LysR family transcriptional regulator [Thauera sp.]|nr:LysR family transcriptional regulator [Thauera sp.]HNV91454.1 LysR family transcriptional regulator [Thauera aminoaromatica]